MKFIIVLLFVSSSGYESVDIIENKVFNSEVQCKSYIKQHYVNHSKLNYYCVESYLVKKNDSNKQRDKLKL